MSDVAVLVGLLLAAAAFIGLMLVIAGHPHHPHRPAAIGIRFSPPWMHRSRPFWRRVRRFFMDTTIQPGESKPGTLVILDQQGNVLPSAVFDAAPTLNSSDPNVFTVSAGATFNDLSVNGVGAGSAVLTADGTSGGVQLQQGRANVTVAVVNNAFAIDIRFA